MSRRLEPIIQIRAEKHTKAKLKWLGFLGMITTFSGFLG